LIFEDVKRNPDIERKGPGILQISPWTL